MSLRRAANKLKKTELAQLLYPWNKPEQQQQAASPAGPRAGFAAKGAPKWRKKATTLSGMVFRNFIGNDLFSGRTPPVGNGDLVVVWPVLGLWHLEKSCVWAGSGRKTEKHNFPVLGALLGGQSGRPKSLSPEMSQLFYILCFGRPDPQRREIAMYWGFRPFWPRTAFGT